MTIEIKTVSGRVLYTSDSTSVRSALIEAASKGADLGGADLWGADLGGANLRGADLQDANLRGADLWGVNLWGVNLQGAKNADLTIARTRILPEEGGIIGWKKCQGGRIVKLKIPTGVKRSHASGRKCRSELAEVLAIFNPDGTETDHAFSGWDGNFRYEVGATVKPTLPFDENPWNECAPGIHWYTSRIEAENYA